MREAKKKKKLKILRLIVVLLILYLVITLFLNILGLKINNIYIRGNYFLTDQEVIDQAKLTNYPNIFTNNAWIIENRLKKHDYIASANIKYSFYNGIKITIKERKRLFLYRKNNSIYLSDNIKLDNDYKPIPTLINYVPRVKFKTLVKRMNNLDRDILLRISDITYIPNVVDDERFVLNMTDGNMVYINLIRFQKLNKYDSIKAELKDNKGILNLDYGANFEVKNW